MTGTPKVKPPKTNQEWARNTERRLGQAEHPVSSRVGNWVLSTDPATDNLIASYVNGGSVILVEPPAGGLDPDAVSTTGLPHIKVSRQSAQAIAVNTPTYINWDVRQRATAGWAFTAPGTDIVVTQAGIYMCSLNVYGTNTASANATTVAGIVVNGQAAFAFVEVPYNDMGGVTLAGGVTDTLQLTAGDAISAQILTVGAGVSIGTSARSVNTVTSLSLTRLPIDL